MLTVHLRINDAQTGRPTPVRLRITGPDGMSYPPLGRLAHFPTGRGESVGMHLRTAGRSYSYIDGACEVPLPANTPLRIEASKGPEYAPIDEEIVLGPGQISLRLTIHRHTRPHDSHWWSGDARTHFLTPHDALLEAQAEGIDFVHVLAAPLLTPSLDGNLYTTIPNLAAFSGQSAALTAADTQVVVGTHNAHPVLGRLGLLHTHRIVFPLTFGGADATDDWSLGDWCDQAHRKNGLTVWTHAFQKDAGMIGGEALLQALLGRIDAIEYDGSSNMQAFLPCWYRMLQAGMHLPLVGSSGRDCNRVPLGGVRTYAQIEPTAPDRYSAWIEAIRAGKTIVTNGPLLELTVDAHGPGSSIASIGETPLHCRARLLAPAKVDRLEVLVNGEVIASGTEQVECEARFTRDSWVVARCWGTGKSLLNPMQSLFAHSSPIYISVPNAPTTRPSSARNWLREIIDRVRDWANTQARFENDRRRDAFFAHCDAAEERLQQIVWE